MVVGAGRTARLSRLPVALVLLAMVAGCGRRPAVRQAAPLTVRFRVGRSMPVRGETVRLTAWVAAEGGEASVVRFAARGPGGRERQIGGRLRATTRGNEPAEVAAAWTPTEVGPWELLCRVTAHGRPDADVRRTVWVTASRLHFAYWGCPTTQHHVTAVMANDKDGAPSRQWHDRGVATLRWKGGYCYAKQWTTSQHYVESWSKVLPHNTGILIDEFSNGNATDQRMGKALVEMRRRHPAMMIVPYCVGLGGDDMVAGFRASDLCLAECYCCDWRYYGRFRRWDALAKHGLAGKSLVALGLGPKWASTEAEIRDQFAYLRTTRPEMPGMSFFGAAKGRLAEAIDRAIEDYFLRPAVLLAWQPGSPAATVRNIGHLPARDVAIVCEHNGRPLRLAIPRLAAGQAKALAIAEGCDRLRIGPAPGRYTVVAYVPPPQRPLPDAAATARASGYLARLRQRTTLDLFASEPKLTVHLSTDEKKKREAWTGNVAAATLPLGERAGRPMAVSVDIETGRCWIYGHIGLALCGGDASLGFRLCRHEPDTDLPMSSPRLMAWFQSTAKDRVHGTLPPGLVQGKLYTVVLSSQADGTARVLVWEKGGRLLWDSGPWRTDGEARFDTLRFFVRPYRGSAIQWEAQPRRLFLRGVSGGPIPSPYRLEGWFSNAKLHVDTKGKTP